MSEQLISLTEAVKSGRLAEFIAQEEARGIGPIKKAELDRDVAALIKVPQSGNQTSHSASDDGSTGKKTRRGSGPCAES